MSSGIKLHPLSQTITAILLALSFGLLLPSFAAAFEISLPGSSRLSKVPTDIFKQTGKRLQGGKKPDVGTLGKALKTKLFGSSMKLGRESLRYPVSLDLSFKAAPALQNSKALLTKEFQFSLSTKVFNGEDKLKIQVDVDQGSQARTLLVYSRSL